MRRGIFPFKGYLPIVVFLSFWPMSAFSHPAGDLYHQAISAIQSQDFQQAESLLQQAITEFPAYAEAHHLLGIVQYQRTQDPSTAIPPILQAVQLHPNFAQAHYDLGLLLLKQDKMKEAELVIQQALTLYPGFWEARLTRAKIFDQIGETDKAIQEYEIVLKQESLVSEALFHLAYHLVQRNQKDRAQELLTRLTTHDPQHAEGWYLLGRLSEQNQRFEQAIDAYTHVVQIVPDHSVAHYNLGVLYQQDKQPQQAIKHFQRVTQLKPTDAEAYVNLGVLLVAEKQFNQAEEAYQKGLALQPNSVEGQFNMGAFYEFHKADLDKAKYHYQKFLNLGGSDVRIQTLMK